MSMKHCCDICGEPMAGQDVKITFKDKVYYISVRTEPDFETPSYLDVCYSCVLDMLNEGDQL
jgi:hypothetical protein